MAGATAASQQLVGAQAANKQAVNAGILAQGQQAAQGLQGKVDAGGYQSVYGGGTPGHYFDNTGAVNAQYNQMQGDVNNVYGQAIASVRGRAPQIASQFQQKIGANDQRAAAQQGALNTFQGQRNRDATQAATNMGLGAAPQPNGPRLALITKLLNSQVGANKKGLDALFGSLKSAAVGRNESNAGAFGYARDQEQQKVAASRAAALAKAKGYIAGSRGHVVSSASSQKAADKHLLTQVNAAIKAQEKAQTANTKAESKVPGLFQQRAAAAGRVT